jgi:Spy/CpxP family protein refolding chaperone
MKSVLKNKVLVSIIGILLLANIAMLVFLVSGMKKPDRGNSESRPQSHSPVDFLQSKIGLTDQQVDQLDQLKEVHHEKLNPLFEDLRTTKDSFFLLIKDSASASAIDSAATLIGEKQKSLDMAVFRTIQEVRNLCTPEQQVKFDSLLPKIAYKMAGHIRKGNTKEDSLKKAH